MMTKFVESSDESFSRFIDYIGRPNAVNPFRDADNAFEYMGYQENLFQEKIFGLFTQNHDLDNDKKEGAKKIFQTAQDNGSLLWQSVISFDNSWLSKYCMYDYEHDELDESKIKQYTRATIAKLQELEGLENAFWTGAIHRNTGNIHIHIAMVEPVPSHVPGKGRCRCNRNGIYQRGMFEKGNIQKVKSKFVSCILADQVENKKLNYLLRSRILSKSNTMDMSSDLSLRIEFLKLASKLPNDLRLLKYNSAAMKDFLPQIDALSDMFIDTYFKEDFDEMKSLALAQQKKYQEIYGGLNNHFYDNKIKDVYARLGNSILTEIRGYKNELRYGKGYKQWNPAQKTKYHKSIVNSLKNTLKKDLQGSKNQSAYDRLRAEEEYAAHNERR